MTKKDAGMPGELMRPVFRTDEYDEAALTFFSQVARGLLVESHPLLKKVRWAERRYSHPQRIDTPTGSASLPTMSMEMTLEFRADDIESGRLQAFSEWAYAAAEQSLAQLMPQFSKNLGAMLDKAGQTVDAKGRPISWDLYLEMLEKLHIEFDRDGRPLTITPESPQAEVFRRAGPMTQKQVDQYDSLIAQKRKEFDARKRYRKLS